MSELTNDEADHVRAALCFLRVRCGGWKPLGKVLHVDPCALRRIADGRTVTASIAFRVARLAGVGVDDVLTGRYPYGARARTAATCPRRWRRFRAETLGRP